MAFQVIDCAGTSSSFSIVTSRLELHGGTVDMTSTVGGITAAIRLPASRNWHPTRDWRQVPATEAASCAWWLDVTL